MGIRSPSQPSDADSISKEICHENGEPAAILDSYSAWLAKHPSALDTFDRMVAAAKGKKIVVFLDYDGTLSPIVEDPDKAFMSDTVIYTHKYSLAMRMAVHEVAHFFPTAIVSGRCLDKVSRFVQLKNVVYAGSHGMDISTPAGSLKQNNPKHETRTVDEQGNEVVHFQPAQEFLPQIQEDINTLQEMVNSIVEAYPNFRISGGKKVMEIRPCIDWDKGRALEYLLDTFGFNNASDFLPLYIGDDKTDEDAFKVIRHMGRGYPIIVSSVPRETKALYSLRDPDEVMSFLRRLARWKKSLGIP
ncbi:putative trehalose-phosphate phosphatase D [Citrus sinensis]|uniref:Trehalose-phosphate phosphatase D n=1 Tax=Citrus sinensis TaxID=2711 RepID=A0ACB8MQ32_CITSI|nr:putative trehalose-phosphate phosphatase D [Citrus sinensis]KAH9787520.1 putative trehalose-phosphate phosphatase D [Citrus sinensis]